MFRNVGAYFGSTVFLLGNVLLQAFGGSLTAGNIRFNHRKSRFAGSCLRFFCGETFSGPFALFILTMHPLGQAPGRSIQCIQIRFRLFQRHLCFFVFSFDR